MNARPSLALLVLASTCLACASRSGSPPDTTGGGEVLLGRRPPEEVPEPGKPLETRPPNAQGQSPAFAGQTRAVAVVTSSALDTLVVAHGLNHPWGFDFLPDGHILVSEKPGTLRVVTRDGQLGEALSGVPEVVSEGEGGLLDVLLDPAFITNRLLYLTFVEPRTDGSGVAVARARLSPDARSLEGVTVLLHALPSSATPSHFGSRLLFGKDGTLFVSLGERLHPPGRVEAQSLDSHMGKILRINTDGTAAAGNPLEHTPGAYPEIYSYGHDNPQGLTVDPRTGELWDLEHGPQGGDELNHIQPGHNYGWPLIAYGTEYTGEPVNGGLTQRQGLEQPLYYWDPAIGPTGGTFYSGDLVPEWKNNLFVAAHNGEHLARLVLEGERVVGEERLLLEQHQKMRQVHQGPDGALWVLTDAEDGRLLRIAPRGR